MRTAYIQCRDCGFKGRVKETSPFNAIFFLLLFFLGIIPGLIYYFWCKGQQRFKCPECGSTNIKIRDIKKETRQMSMGEAMIIAIPILLIFLMLTLNNL